jgi:hypothetical protein
MVLFYPRKILMFYNSKCPDNWDLLMIVPHQPTVHYTVYFTLPSTTHYTVYRTRPRVSTVLHCGENSRIFRDAANQTLPVTEYSKIENWFNIKLYIFRKIQLQVTFGLLYLGKSVSFFFLTQDNTCLFHKNAT